MRIVKGISKYTLLHMRSNPLTTHSLLPEVFSVFSVYLATEGAQLKAQISQLQEKLERTRRTVTCGEIQVQTLDMPLYETQSFSGNTEVCSGRASGSVPNVTIRSEYGSTQSVGFFTRTQELTNAGV